MCQSEPTCNSHRGIAAVELAICLPVLTLLIFGSIQACDAIYLRHTVVTAAHEGSLELARPDSTTAAVAARIEQVLTVRGVTAGTYLIGTGGQDVGALANGDQVTVQVSAPIVGNVALTGFFPLPGSVSFTLTCTR